MLFGPCNCPLASSGPSRRGLLCAGGAGFVTAVGCTLVSAAGSAGGSMLVLTLVPCSAPGVGSGSFLQPCMSKASKPMPWMARTTNTAILTRARPWFFCSRSEPCGRSGLELFMVIVVDNFLIIVEAFWVWFLPRVFPSKKPGAKLCISTAANVAYSKRHGFTMPIGVLGRSTATY